MKKKCDVVRLFENALKASRAWMLLISVAVSLASCATAGGAGAGTTVTLRSGDLEWTMPEYGLGNGLGIDGFTPVPLEGITIDNRDDMDRLRGARLDLLMYTLGDFFLECRETGMEKARIAGAADAVEFEDPYTARFFRHGWDACAELGVEAVEAGKAWEKITWQMRAEPEGWSSNIETRVEIKLLETLIPIIWRDDYESFLSVAMRWGGYSAYRIIERFKRSPSWTGWDKLASFWDTEEKLAAQAVAASAGRHCPRHPLSTTI